MTTTNNTTTNGDDFNKDKVLARVKKMMNLANDAAATEGERDNALRMAHATLAKYNLSMAEASSTDLSGQEKRVDMGITNLGFPWAKQTAFAVAKLFFCQYFTSGAYTRGGNKRSDACKHYFVGRESNAITASEMAVFVMQSIFREANKRRVEEYHDWSWHTSFCKGAAMRVLQRCEKLRLDAERANDGTQVAQRTGTAVVLASFYKQELALNDAFIAEHHGKLRTSVNRERNTGVDGYHAGAAFGDRVSLNRQVGSNTTTRRIK